MIPAEQLAALEAARELISDPERWLPAGFDEWAHDHRGRQVNPDDPEARQWSLEGALDATCRSIPTYHATRQFLFAQCTHADALALLDRAIAALRAEVGK